MRRSADTRRGLALLAVGLLVLAACGGGDGVESPRERLGVPDGSPLPRFLPDPPLFGVRMAAGIDAAGWPVVPAATFDATDPAVTAIVALGKLDGEATLEIEWRAIEAGIGESERLFAHEINVRSFEHAYSVGVSPGRLAAGLYEVNASLGAHEVSTIWRVADAEQGSGAASVTADAGPPASGESGLIKSAASEASTPGAEGDCDGLQIEGDKHSSGGLWVPYGVHAFPISWGAVSSHQALYLPRAECPTAVVSAAVVGPAVEVARHAPLFRDAVDPCELPGGSDMPGTVVHLSARYAGDRAELAGDQVVLKDPEEPPLVVFQSDPPSGSRVEAGDTVRLAVLAYRLPFAKGIRWGELRSHDDVLFREEREEPTPCDIQRLFLRWDAYYYRVPEDPPPVIELSAVVEDWDGLSTTETITLVTSDAWTLTISSDTRRDYLDPDYNEPGKYQISPGSCSDSWVSEFTFVVQPDGTFTADGTARPTGGTACSFPMTAPPLTSRTLMISGTASADVFELQIVQTGFPAGQGDYAAYASLCLDDGFAARTITLPRIGGDIIRAEHTYTLRDFSGPFDVYTSVNTFELRRAQKQSE